jgi:hypothetical protein
MDVKSLNILWGVVPENSGGYSCEAPEHTVDVMDKFLHDLGDVGKVSHRSEESRTGNLMW